MAFNPELQQLADVRTDPQDVAAARHQLLGELPGIAGNPGVQRIIRDPRTGIIESWDGESVLVVTDLGGVNSYVFHVVEEPLRPGGSGCRTYKVNAIECDHFEIEQ